MKSYEFKVIVISIFKILNDKMENFYRRLIVIKIISIYKKE